MASPDSPETPPVQGLVAGKYELLGLIGRGGMGSVWEGRHASLGTRVAIKFIDTEYASSTEARSRFDNEARAAATLQSKHAIQIFDHGCTPDGRPYIVMELLLGEPLDKRIERFGRISLPETARILGQVCRALQRAHEQGIIHRDLKPENIFLVRSPDEDDEIAKVLDFGIAKIKSTPGSPGISSSTKTGAVMGTPYYMSPEQARGLRTVDHRSDLWSLGVIAFKCVTGILPFEGESVGDLLVKICTASPPAPSLVVAGLPSSFDAWFSRALEREPARRFGSAAELSEGLSFASGLSIRRGPTSSQPRPHRDSSPSHGGAQPGSTPQTRPASDYNPVTPPTHPFTPYPGAAPYGTPPAGGMPYPGAPHLLGDGTPRLNATPQFPGAQFPGGPAMTAAPFTNSAPIPPQRSSRALLWTGLGVIFIGVSVGAFALVKVVAGGPTSGGQANVEPTKSARAWASALPVPVVTAEVEPALPDLSPATNTAPPAIVAAATTTTKAVKPPPGATHPLTKPPASAPPDVKTEVKTAPPPPPPPPKSTTPDPGY